MVKPSGTVGWGSRPLERDFWVLIAAGLLVLALALAATVLSMP
jgi:hypothetical protein